MNVSIYLMFRVIVVFHFMEYLYNILLYRTRSKGRRMDFVEMNLKEGNLKKHDAKNRQRWTIMFGNSDPT